MKISSLIFLFSVPLITISDAEDINRCLESDTTMGSNSIGPMIQFNGEHTSFGAEYSRILNTYSVFFNSTRPIFGHVFTGVYSTNHEYAVSYGFEVVSGRYLSCLGRKQNGAMRNPMAFTMLVPGIELGVDYSSRKNIGGHITAFFPWLFIFPFISYKQFVDDSDINFGIVAKFPLNEVFMP